VIFNSITSSSTAKRVAHIHRQHGDPITLLFFSRRESRLKTDIYITLLFAYLTILIVKIM
jgi:hypothetical protein